MSNKVGIQEQDQRTYENSAEAKRVMSVDESGSYVSPSGETSLTLQLDEAGLGITYVGDAVIGSLTSEAVWRIKRLDESGDPELIIKWADGDADFNNIFDNRASLTYI